MTETVILVNTKDQMIGTMEKMAAHQNGALHRAFSVFVFNTKGELLLQQRALTKYHSGGLWTNSCCGHPRPGENILKAGRRRLTEEMGIDCLLEELFLFQYRHEFENGLTEHEADHVLIGFSDQLPEPDPVEVADFTYVDPDTLAAELLARPEVYTAWLVICYDRVLATLKKLY